MCLILDPKKEDILAFFAISTPRTRISEKGVKEAESGGQALKEAGYKFDVAHTSLLTRAQVTLSKVLN